MIYEVKKTIKSEEEGVEDRVYSFEIDDLTSFKDQSREFREICNASIFCGEVMFDNAIITIVDTGRVLVSYKELEI